MADSSEPHSALSGWQIYALAAQQDPYAAWDEIRAASPVLDAGEGVYLVTSWELVDQVLRDHSLLAGRGVAESLDVERGDTVVVEVARSVGAERELASLKMRVGGLMDSEGEETAAVGYADVQILLAMERYVTP